MLIVEGNYSSVIHHKGRYYAANRDSRTIQVFEQPSNQWKQCYFFSIEAESNSYITLGISTELLYVCSATDARIEAYTLCGVHQFNADRRRDDTSDELNYPLICGTDSSGAALIADYGNDLLQVLSVGGQWSIVQVQPSVSWPKGAVLVNGTLYVGECQNLFTKEYSINSYIPGHA